MTQLFAVPPPVVSLKVLPPWPSTIERLLYSGAGSPAGVVTAPVGSLYLRTDGGANTTLYVKESGTGTSGWVAK